MAAVDTMPTMAVRHYPELEAESRRALAEREWSLRKAEIQTGLSSAVIHNMTRGIRPRPESLEAWAIAIQENPNRWLQLAGYRIVPTGDEWPPTVAEVVRESPGEYTREPVDDPNPFERAGFSDDGRRWSELSEEQRENFRQLMDSILASRGDVRDQG